MDAWMGFAVAVAGIAVSPVTLRVQLRAQERQAKEEREHAFHLRDYDTDQRLWQERVKNYTALTRIVEDYLLRTVMDRQFWTELNRGESPLISPSDTTAELDRSELAAATSAVEATCSPGMGMEARNVARALVGLADTLGLRNTDVVDAERKLHDAMEAFRAAAATDIAPPPRR